MYKIKHISTGLFLSTFIDKSKYSINLFPVERYLSKYGKCWSTENGPNDTLEFINLYFPNQFEKVKFVEEK